MQQNTQSIISQRLASGNGALYLIVVATAIPILIVIYLLVAMYANDKKQAELFQKGNTIWCQRFEGENIAKIPISKEKGYTYDAEQDIFVSPGKEFAIPNKDGRCGF